MSKQDHIEFRQGRAAFRRGQPFSLRQPHCWKMGWLEAERAAKPALVIDTEDGVRHVFESRYDENDNPKESW